MKWFFCCLFVFLSLNSFGKNVNDSIPKKKNIFQKAARLTDKNLNLLPIPEVSYRPERGFSFGLAVDYFFNAGKDSLKAVTRNSIAYVQFQYTTRNQTIADAQYQIYTMEKFL
jgi:hypothetical protein